MDVRARILTAQDSTWSLWLDGTISGDTVTFSRVVISASADSSNVKAEASISEAVALTVPGALLKGTETAREFKSLDEIVGDAELALRHALLAFVARARNLTIAWDIAETKAGFFGATSFGSVRFSGQARIILDGLVSSGGKLSVSVAARAIVKADITTGAGTVIVDGAYGFSVELSPSETPQLEFDFAFPQCPISLPRIPFPNLSFGNFTIDRMWPRIGAQPDLLGTLGLNVALATPPVDVTLAVANGVLTWSLGPETIVVSTTGGQAVVTIVDIAIRHDSGADTLVASYTISANAAFEISDDTHELGPLAIAWRDVDVTSGVEMPANGAMRAHIDVAFQHVRLFAREDPKAVIAFAGLIRLTPDGVEIRELRLVEPYPIEILARLAEASGRAVDNLLRLVAVVPKRGPSAPSPAPLFDALARIASAAARAIVFAGEAVGDLLAGLARFVGDLLNALGSLANAPDRRLLIEVRIATDPIQLRQVLVTALDLPPAEGDRFDVLGFELTVSSGWRPGLLIDLVDAPGAYLMVFRGDAAPETIATLKTDLWLSRDAVSEPLRDADGSSGDRAAEPLLTLTVKDATPAQPLAVALAGVSRGRGVFFQRVEGVVKDTLDTGPVVLVTGDGYGLAPLSGSDVEVQVDFKADRVLPLLGMREPQAAGPGTTFLAELQKGLGQVVWLKRHEKPAFADGVVTTKLVLGLRVAGIETEITIDCHLALRTLTARLGTSKSIPILLAPQQFDALGLVFQFSGPQLDPPDQKQHIFDLEFGEDTRLALASGARAEVRFPGVSRDGRGIVFDIDPAREGVFRVSRAGLDLVAVVRDEPVTLNGVAMPFRFTVGKLTISSNTLVDAAIAGSGRLPPELIGEANALVAIKFARTADGTMVIESATAVLEKAGEPIVCHSTRFTITINELGFSFVEDHGYHFYFLISGSAEFRPNAGEFDDGLLKHLSSIRIVLDRVPLAGDARVLARHISFQVALSPKKTFSLFDLFQFELRGIGFHPSTDVFDGAPAMNISGQIRFVDIGDVMQPKIDFHGLYIAPPANGGIGLPRIKAQQLGVDIGLTGAARISGTVAAVDGRLPTLIAPIDYPRDFKAHGFLGQGTLWIEGWGQMAASMGFLEISQSGSDELKRAFFLYLERQKVSYEIPTPIWPLFLREVGFGFGYRYTLAGIRAAEDAETPQQLIRTLDNVAKRQGELASFAAWAPDVERAGESPRVTLALRGAMTLTTASEQEKYNDKGEKELPNPFLFDVVAALRSDMTFLMSLRGWLSLNYADFVDAGPDVRDRPGFLGYLFISAPRSEFLGRFLSNPDCHIGSHPPLPELVHRALRSVQWSATLYIRPGLFHFELGWPNKLSVTLANDPNLRVRVAGGFVFRIADGALLQGFNIEADAFMRFGGTIGGSAFGVSLEALLEIGFVARMIAYIDTRRFSDTLFYGLVSLHARLVFSVQAWLHIDLGLVEFTLRIGFSFTLQISCALELAIGPSGIGARGRAHVVITVFGCSLGVGVGFTIGGGFLDEARQRVDRFLAVGLTADTPAPGAEMARANADKRIAAQAANARREHPSTPELPPANAHSLDRTSLGRDITQTDFWMVLHKAVTLPEGLTGDDAKKTWYYAFFVPRELTGSQVDLAAAALPSTFYAEPPASPTPCDKPDAPVDHTVVSTTGLADPGIRFLTHKGLVEPVTVASPINMARKMCWEVQASPDTEGITARNVFAECFLYKGSTDETTITYEAFKEPQPIFIDRREVDGSDDDARTRERDQLQRAHEADRRHFSYNQQAHDLRTTLLAQFLEQFAALANAGARPADVKDLLHVLDTGLVCLVDAAVIGEKGSLRNEGRDLHLQIEKRRGASTAKGSVSVFNPPEWHFEATGTRPEDDEYAVTANGVTLGWQLTDPTNNIEAIDYHLRYYEVRRRIEGFDEIPVFVKPAAMFGQDEDAKPGVRCVVPPDWQTTDELADLPEDVRKALLGGAGDTAAREQAAIRFAHWFGGRPVTVTYDVTPVDTAGTVGDTLSFPIDIFPPLIDVPAARGELTFEFDEIADLPQATADPTKEVVPANIDVFIGLADRPENQSAPIEKTYTYRLLAEYSEIVAAGTYGADALVDSVGSPLNTGAANFAEAIARFSNADLEAAEQIERLNQDDETNQGQMNRGLTWYRLAAADPAKPGLLKGAEAREFITALWRSKETRSRAACRFYLETEVALKQGGIKPDPRQSGRRPVPFEMHLCKTTPDAKGKPVTRRVSAFRPEIFEWPVQVTMPTYRLSELQAASGFALIKMPLPGGDVDALLDNRGVVLPRDPERRMLTQVRWSAFPLRGDRAADSLRQYYAGYDVHQLDVDELPSTQLHADGSPLESVWQSDHVKHVARAQLLTRSAAALVPHDTTPLQNWQASYPSDTWRTLRSSSSGGAKPVLRPWFSTSESTLDWPRMFYRRQLLPSPDEQALAEVFAKGLPKTLRVTASCTYLHLEERRTVAVALKAGVFFIDKKLPEDTVTAILEVRSFLRELTWVPDEEMQTALRDHGSTAIEAMSVAVTMSGLVKADKQPDPAVSFPVVFNASLHPILDELLHALSTEPPIQEPPVANRPIARRTTVLPVPPPTGGAKSLAEFLNNTDAGKDPFGWGVLQTLGLARALRAYDDDRAEFLEPRDLVERVNACLKKILLRYKGEAGLTAPIVEVLLRPGHNAEPGAFDVPARDEAGAQDSGIALDDDALAMVQVSFRPQPLPLFGYVVLTFHWPPNQVSQASGDLRMKLTAADEQMFDLLHVESRSTYAFNKDVRTATLVVPPARTTSKRELAIRDFTLVLRVPREPLLAFVREATGVDLATRRSIVDIPPDKLKALVNIEFEGQDMRPRHRAFAALFPNQLENQTNPFELFDACAAKIVDAAIAGKSDARAKGSWHAFGLWTRPLAEHFAFPAPSDEKIAVLTQYLSWCPRFLEHTAMPLRPSGAGLPFALAAPDTKTPYRVAPTDEGLVSLSILHKDRWARVRAYVVRPFGRYEPLVRIVRGASAVEPNVGSDPKKPETAVEGFAVAVTPRTERVETPMILASRRTDPDQKTLGKTWELVIARHPEQALTESNRALFAHLAFEGTSLAFVREYRYPDWPGRFMLQEEVLEYPQISVQSPLAYKPDESESLTGLALDELSRRYPTLWRGADVYRFARLPHYYRVIAFAAARAGIVTSPIATVTQQDFHYSLPILEERGHWEVVLQDGARCVRITWPLVTHRDCTDAPEAWTPRGSVADLPDPEVTYAVLLTDGSSTQRPSVEEGALDVTRPEPPDPPQTAPPYEVRARGTRLKNPRSLVITHHPPPDETSFARFDASVTADVDVTRVATPVSPVAVANAMVALANTGRLAGWAEVLQRVELTVARPEADLAVWRMGVTAAADAYRAIGGPGVVAAEALAQLAAMSDAEVTKAFNKVSALRPIFEWQTGTAIPAPTAFVTGALATEIALTVLPTDDELTGLLDALPADPAIAEAITALVFDLARKQLFGGTNMVRLRAFRGLATPVTSEMIPVLTERQRP